MLTLSSSHRVYLACGSTDLRKSMYWEHNGFWLFYRRLERGTFQWPTGSEGTITVSSRELRWLLDRLALTQRQAHPKVTAETVI